MVIYRPAEIGGSVTLPPSKSIAHRALICAGLSGGVCEISNISESDDILATLGALNSLGIAADSKWESGKIIFPGKVNLEAKTRVIDCMASGSTLRFFIPIAAALGGETIFTGRDRLPERPIGIYEKLLPKHGVKLETKGGLPLKVSGKLEPGKFDLPGDVSSQFVTGLLLALPILGEESEVFLTSPLQSAGYVEMTVSVLKSFGIDIEKTENGWRVPRGARYRAADYRVEGDYSQAAFFLCLAALSPSGGEVRLRGLNRESTQGDMACVEEFRRFGLSADWDGEELVARNLTFGLPFGGLKGHRIDVSQIPDLMPAMAVCAAFSEGETVFCNARRLRLKESDRILAMQDAINAIGGNARSTEDELIINGSETVQGGKADGRKDHRVVMALSAAAQRCFGEVRVTDEESISKSYPAFFKDLRALGGVADVVRMG